MNTTFTSQLQNFSAEYITRLLNAGANSSSLRNEVLNMHKTVANAELKVLNQIISQAPQAEWSARTEKQQALKAQRRLLSVQNIKEKNASQLAFKMPIDAHKHRRKPPALRVAKASYSAQNNPSTTM